MGALRKLKRNLNEKSVWVAQEVQRKQVELAQKFVEERVAQDAEFARDVLEAVGDNLPANIKKIAEETVAKEAMKDDRIQSEAFDKCLTNGKIDRTLYTVDCPCEADPNVTTEELQKVANEAVNEMVDETYGNPEPLPLKYDKDKHKLP